MNGYRYYGDECQAVLYCHTDKEHEHVHVMLNRAHPRHGRMLPDGNDHLKLSRYQERRERENEKIVTPQRVLNNQARDRGEYVKHTAKIPRATYEAMKSVDPAADEQKRALLEQQKQRARRIAIEQRDAKTRQRRQWIAMEGAQRRRAALIEQDYREHLQRLERESRLNAAKQVGAIRDDYAPRWSALLQQDLEEAQLFRQREATFKGKLANAMQVMDLKGFVRRERDEEGRAARFSDLFRVIGSEGARQQALERQQRARATELEKEQKAKEAAIRAQQKIQREEAETNARRHRQMELASSRARAAQDRADLVQTHEQQNAAAKARWKQHDRDAAAQWRELAKEHPAPAVSPPQLRKTIEERMAELDRQRAERSRGEHGREERDR